MNNRLEIQEFAKIYCNKGANSNTSLHSYLENGSGFYGHIFSDKINFSEPSHHKNTLLIKGFCLKNDRFKCLRMQRKAHQRASLCLHGLERKAIFGFVLRLMRGSFLTGE